MSTDAPGPVLRELAAVCRQDERGFAGAADAIRSKGIKAALRRYGLQRSRLAAELEQHISRLAGDGHVAAVRLFGAWADLPTAVHRDESAVLDECARSEAITRQRFEWALERDLPLNVRMVVHRQYTEIKAALQWLGRAQIAASVRKHSFHGA
ncbi:MAG TPA: PA2169 family four-helix-bundle protein [Pirellulales bacterium]